MIGKNVLTLNEATMKEAVTLWLASFTMESIGSVESVKPSGDQNCTFLVTIQSDPNGPK